MVSFAILMCANFLSCSNNNENIPVINDEFIEVPLQIKTNFSIDITDEPISRSTEQPVYAIEVLEINPNTSYYESYAFGFFKSTDNLSVNLKKSGKYKIKVALYYNYFDNYRFGSYNEKYVYYETYTDTFTYVDKGSFHGVTAWYDYSEDNIIKLSLINGDTFYGELDKFSPSYSNACSVELERISTAIEFTVEGLKEGIVKLNVGNNYSAGSRLIHDQLTTEKTSLSQIFTPNELVTNETVKISVSATYISSNEKETSLISDSYIFTRNMKKRFLIKLEKNETDETNIGLKLSLIDIEFKDEEQSTYTCVIE